MPATNADTLRSIFSDIAGAIRGKLSSQVTYEPDEMAAAIASIPTGGGWDGIIVESLATSEMQYKSLADQYNPQRNTSPESSLNVVSS